MNEQALNEKEEKLIKTIEQLGSVIVAYSGGVDSSLLAYWARKILNVNAKIIIAVSPTLAEDELKAARQQAEMFYWDLIEINTDELVKPEYRQNNSLRCYFCKTTLFEALEEISTRFAIRHLAYGANKDDLLDFRPGHLAAGEHKVVSPLQSSGLSKEEIRTLARKAGLPSWQRPQTACLASRFKTGTPITVSDLARVDKAEHFIRSLGFNQVRVRHHGHLALVEIGKDELARLSENAECKQLIAEQLKMLGYSQIVLDTQGYRAGSVNSRLPKDKDKLWIALG